MQKVSARLHTSRSRSIGARRALVIHAPPVRPAGPAAAAVRRPPGTGRTGHPARRSSDRAPRHPVEVPVDRVVERVVDRFVYVPVPRTLHPWAGLAWDWSAGICRGCQVARSATAPCSDQPPSPCPAGGVEGGWSSAGRIDDRALRLVRPACCVTRSGPDRLTTADHLVVVVRGRAAPAATLGAGPVAPSVPAALVPNTDPPPKTAVTPPRAQTPDQHVPRRSGPADRGVGPGRAGDASALATATSVPVVTSTTVPATATLGSS